MQYSKGNAIRKAKWVPHYVVLEPLRVLLFKKKDRPKTGEKATETIDLNQDTFVAQLDPDDVPDGRELMFRVVVPDPEDDEDADDPKKPKQEVIFTCDDDDQFDKWLTTLEDWCQLANYAAVNGWTLEASGKMYDDNGQLKYDPDENFEEADGGGSEGSAEEHNIERINTGNIDHMVAEMSMAQSAHKDQAAPTTEQEAEVESTMSSHNHSGRLTTDSHGRQIFQPEYLKDADSGPVTDSNTESQRKTDADSGPGTVNNTVSQRQADDSDDDDELFPNTGPRVATTSDQKVSTNGMGETKIETSRQTGAGDNGPHSSVVSARPKSDFKGSPHRQDRPLPKSKIAQDARRHDFVTPSRTSVAPSAPSSYTDRTQKMYRSGNEPVSRNRPALQGRNGENNRPAESTASAQLYRRSDDHQTSPAVSLSGADAARAAAQAIGERFSDTNGRVEDSPSRTPAHHFGGVSRQVQSRPTAQQYVSPKPQKQSWLPGLNEMLNVWDEMTSDMQGMLPVFRLQDLLRRLRLDFVSLAKLQYLNSTLDPNHDGLISRANFLDWWQSEAPDFFYGESSDPLEQTSQVTNSQSSPWKGYGDTHGAPGQHRLPSDETFSNKTLQGLAEQIQKNQISPNETNGDYKNRLRDMEEEVTATEKAVHSLDQWPVNSLRPFTAAVNAQNEKPSVPMGSEARPGLPFFEAYSPYEESCPSSYAPSESRGASTDFPIDDLESRESVFDAFIQAQPPSNSQGHYKPLQKNNVGSANPLNSLKDSLCRTLLSRSRQLVIFPDCRHQLSSTDIMAPHLCGAIGSELLEISRKNAFSAAALGMTLAPEATGSCISGHSASTELHWLPPGMKAILENECSPLGLKNFKEFPLTVPENDSNPSPWVDHGQSGFGLRYQFSLALQTLECQCRGLDAEGQIRLINKELGSGINPVDLQNRHGHAAVNAATGTDTGVPLEDFVAGRPGEHIFLPPDMLSVAEIIWTRKLLPNDWNKCFQRVCESREFTFSEAVEKSVSWSSLAGRFAARARKLATQIVQEMCVSPHLREIDAVKGRKDTFYSEGIIIKLVDSIDRRDAEKGGILRRVVTHELNHNRLLLVTSLKERRHKLVEHPYDTTDSRMRLLPLSVPLSTVVDVYGFRFHAVAWLPEYTKTLAGEAALRPCSPNAPELVYGKPTPEHSFVDRDDLVHSTVKHVGKALNLQQHSIETLKEKEDENYRSEDRDIATSIVVPLNGDVQVYKGGDRRNYVFNSARLMPSDNPEPYRRDGHAYLLRPELVVSWKRRISSDAFRGVGKDGRLMEKPLSRSQEKKEPAFTTGDVADRKTNDADASSLSHYRDSTLIPVLVKALDDLEYIPTSSEELRTLLHSHGINARNIGQMTEQVERSHVRTLLEIEMISRAGKHILNNNMRKLIFSRTEGGVNEDLSDDVTRQLMVVARDFFNLVLGEGEDSQTFWEQLIIPSVKNKFHYRLPHQSYPKYQLFYALQYHTGVVFVDTDFAAVPGVRDDSAIDYSMLNTHQDRAEAFANSKPAQTFDNSEPLKVQEMLPWTGRTKTMLPPRCPERLVLAHTAEEYAASGLWHSAIHAYNVRMCMVQSTQVSAAGERSNPSEDSFFGVYIGAIGSFQIACTLLEIARMYAALHDFAKGLEATHTGLKYIPARHPLAAKLLMVRSQCFAMQARVEESKSVYNAAVAVVATTLGSRHPLLASFATAMGCTLIAAADEVAGFNRLQKALEIYEINVGPYHPCVANMYEHVGRLYLWKGSFQEALTSLERAYVLREHSVRRKSPSRTGRKEKRGLDGLIKNLRKVVNKCTGRDISVVPGAQIPSWFSVINSVLYRRCCWARTCLLLSVAHAGQVQERLRTLRDPHSQSSLQNECEEITVLSRQCHSTYDAVLQHYSEVDDETGSGRTSGVTQVKRQISRLCDCNASSALLMQNKPREALSHVETLFADARLRRRDGRRPPSDEFVQKLMIQLITCVYYSFRESERAQLLTAAMPKVSYVLSHPEFTRYVLRRIWEAPSPADYIRMIFQSAISGNVHLYKGASEEAGPTNQLASILLLSSS